MKKGLTILSIILATSFFVRGGEAQEITLFPGEFYSTDELNILCTQSLPTPIAIKECQFWGGYDDERCLYEKTIFAVEGKQCVEECQQWKETGKRCLYPTKCEFYRDQQIFVETRCIDFNEFISKCEKTVKKVID